MYLNLNVLPVAHFQIWGVGVGARWSSSASSQPPICHYQKFALSSRTHSFFYYYSNLSQNCWPMLYMVKYTYMLYMGYTCIQIYIFKADHALSFANIHLNCYSKGINMSMCYSKFHYISSVRTTPAQRRENAKLIYI